MYEYAATIIEIVDGDTLKLDVDLGFKLRLRGTFRLARCNAPELLSIAGVQAKAFVIAQLKDVTNIRVETHRSEKYGRWLCEFRFQTAADKFTWHNLTDLLLQSKNAVPFKH
jgi:endonuclease YncB( thermonuclease family)